MEDEGRQNLHNNPVYVCHVIPLCVCMCVCVCVPLCVLHSLIKASGPPSRSDADPGPYQMNLPVITWRGFLVSAVGCALEQPQPPEDPQSCHNAHHRLLLLYFCTHTRAQTHTRTRTHTRTYSHTHIQALTHTPPSTIKDGGGTEGLGCGRKSNCIFISDIGQLAR